MKAKSNWQASLNNIKLIFFFFSLFVSIHLFAQQTITGTVQAEGELSGAIITLLNANDSSLVKTTLCEPNGNFVISNLKAGRYILNISHIGFIPYFSSLIELNNNHQVQLDKIVLLSSPKNLKEITITGKKQFIEQKIDRLVLNPDALIGNAGGNALEILEKAPGVQVDVNGTISFKGKQGVMVFIDDKPSFLSAQDLANYLRSLPAVSSNQLN
jgi:hypothetical protein